MVLDSENALDTDYLEACGVDVEDDNYLHVSVSTLGAAVDAIHQITEDYHAARAKKELDKMPRLLIVGDSLDFMFVDSMIKKFDDSGEMGSDQGLHAKKMKQLLQTIVYDIKFLPAIALFTKQVYVDQTPNANPPVKMTESVKFALTQLLLITRLMTRDDKTKTYDGILLRVFAWKTRGCKPFQRCEIKVPYDSGMDEYEGLLQIAVQLGIVDQAGAWFSYNGNKWQGADKWRTLDVSIKEEIFQKIVAADIGDINYAEGADELDVELEGARKPKKSKVAESAKKIAERKANKERVDDTEEESDNNEDVGE